MLMLNNLCLFRCPDLHTMVLFVTSLAHTDFLEAFLQQRHNNMASLQVPCWPSFALQEDERLLFGEWRSPHGNAMDDIGH